MKSMEMSEVIRKVQTFRAISAEEPWLKAGEADTGAV